MAQNTLTAFDALAALAPLIGAGGLTSIIIAIVSYMKAAKEGRRGDPEHAGLGISAQLADSSSISKLVLSIDRLALAADKVALLSEESKQELFQKAHDFLEEFIKLRRQMEDLVALQHRQHISKSD